MLIMKIFRFKTFVKCDVSRTWTKCCCATYSQKSSSSTDNKKAVRYSLGTTEADVVAKLIQTHQIYKDGVLIEINAGHGSLTKALIKYFKKRYWCSDSQQFVPSLKDVIAGAGSGVLAMNAGVLKKTMNIQAEEEFMSKAGIIDGPMTMVGVLHHTNMTGKPYILNLIKRLYMNDGFFRLRPSEFFFICDPEIVRLWMKSVSPDHQSTHVGIQMDLFFDINILCKIPVDCFKPVYPTRKKFRKIVMDGEELSGDHTYLLHMVTQPYYEDMSHQDFSRFFNFTKDVFRTGKLGIVERLESLVPGSEEILLNNGFTKQQKQKELSAQQLYQIYKIITTLPGYKNSVLKHRLEDIVEDYHQQILHQDPVIKAEAEIQCLPKNKDILNSQQTVFSQSDSIFLSSDSLEDTHVEDCDQISANHSEISSEDFRHFSNKYSELFSHSELQTTIEQHPISTSDSELSTVDSVEHTSPSHLEKKPDLTKGDAIVFSQKEEEISIENKVCELEPCNSTYKAEDTPQEISYVARVQNVEFMNSTEPEDNTGEISAKMQEDNTESVNTTELIDSEEEISCKTKEHSVESVNTAEYSCKDEMKEIPSETHLCCENESLQVNSSTDDATRNIHISSTVGQSFQESLLSNQQNLELLMDTRAKTLYVEDISAPDILLHDIRRVSSVGHVSTQSIPTATESAILRENNSHSRTLETEKEEDINLLDTAQPNYQPKLAGNEQDETNVSDKLSKLKAVSEGFWNFFR